MEKINSNDNFIRLINQYQNLIFSICLKLTGDYFTAEDMTQETFLSAFNHFEEFDGEAEKAWLCRIASNKCIDYLKAAKRREQPVEDEAFQNEAVSEDNPLQEVLNKEIVEDLKRKCDSLKEPYRQVALYYFAEGKKAKEIAQISGNGIHTVQTHIRRAREMLKKIYGRERLNE